MTSTDFPAIDDPPSDVPTRRSSKERQQPGRENQQSIEAQPETKTASGNHPGAKDHEERPFILLLLKRDSQSWNEFVERYERLIVSRILSTCRECGLSPRPDLVEDCAAEVMAALFQNEMQGLRQFQGRSKLSTWLAVIVRRTTLNVLRRQQRDNEKIRPNDSQFDIATVPDPFSQGTIDLPAEERVQLQACMTQLKQTDRQALVMYFDQKLSYAEIGHTLGITENAVGPKLHRAQKRLKKLMKASSKQT
ncbi:RNA polymerase sigma factor [uncultured Gimesia sp.]|uniref:RNA polymerase sigma factor n=1 Tax=uncultured Gimesia sp. TaxID=1678688 RepID=UPI0030DA102B|tara:strand:- start:52034 stop:52783 length:750 start_codon:yes stop_codon:yes gene_type:complete